MEAIVLSYPPDTSVQGKSFPHFELCLSIRSIANKLYSNAKNKANMTLSIK